MKVPHNPLLFLCAAIDIANQEILCYRFTMHFFLTALYLAFCVILQMIFFHWCTFRPPSAYWHCFEVALQLLTLMENMPVLLLAIFNGRTPEMDWPDSSLAWLWFGRNTIFRHGIKEFKFIMRNVSTKISKNVHIKYVYCSFHIMRQPMRSRGITLKQDQFHDTKLYTILLDLGGDTVCLFRNIAYHIGRCHTRLPL